MAIIPGDAIKLEPTLRAGSVIRKMEEVLAQRHRLQITRRIFLIRWLKLRKALFLTQEYQALRARVKAREAGKCQRCLRGGAHVHHVKSVVRHLRLVFIDENCEWLCKHCHKQAELKAEAA